MTFTQAREKLGNRTSRKVANNTYLVDLGGYIGLRLHGTIIVSYHPDQTKVFTGGWRTVTTKARINDYLPAGRICQKAGTWYWCALPVGFKPPGIVTVKDFPCFEEGDAVIQLAGDNRMAVTDKNGLVKGTL
jgi:hypothetical protein